MRITSTGNVGIGTAGPSDGKLVVSSGAIVTDGIAANRKAWQEGDSRGVYALNKSGNALSSGTVVQQFTGEAGAYSVAITTNAADEYWPVGTIYDSSCAAGTYCKICTEGICPARLVSDEACSATDRKFVFAGDEDGRAQCGSGAEVATDHDGEIGQPASFTASNGDVILIWAHRN